MNEPAKAHRRDFLFGRSAMAAAREQGEQLLGGQEAAGQQGMVSGPAENHFLLEFSRRAMACDFQVLLPADGPETGPEWALEALEYLEELEDRWSAYRDHSQMSLVNRCAAEQEVPLDEDLYELLSLGKRLHSMTSGAFEMTAGPLTKAWGFFRQEGRMPSPAELSEARAVVGTQWVELEPTRRTVRYLKSGVDINLGGIGKGYAVDLCVDRLSWHGLQDFLFHGGQSSVVARGHRHPRLRAETDGTETESPTRTDTPGPGTGWRIGVLHPIWPGKRLLEVQLNNEALGTSGTSRQHFYHQGQRYGHIFDPRTGQPVSGVYSTTIIAPTAAEADALATACYVMGPEQALAFCEQHPEYGLIMVVPGRTRQDISLVTCNLPDTQWERLID